jgi:transcription elongation GreA/GreB family factor
MKAVSVLAPVGSALLGLSIGQSIDWNARRPQAAPARDRGPQRHP